MPADEYRRLLPEELWDEYDSYSNGFLEQFDDYVRQVRNAYDATSHLSDRDLGMSLGDLSPIVRQFIFSARKGDFFKEVNEPGSRDRKRVFKLFRPKGNIVDQSSKVFIEGSGK